MMELHWQTRVRNFWISYQQFLQTHYLVIITFSPIVFAVNSYEVFQIGINMEQTITVKFKSFDARAVFSKETQNSAVITVYFKKVVFFRWNHYRFISFIRKHRRYYKADHTHIGCYRLQQPGLYRCRDWFYELLIAHIKLQKSKWDRQLNIVFSE